MGSEDILNKYRARLNKEVKFEDYESGRVVSKEYHVFRDELKNKRQNSYEKLCNICEKIIKIKPSEKNILKLEKSIEAAHLNITIYGAISFAVLAAFLLIFIGILFGVLNYLTTGSFSIFLPLFFIIVGIILIKPLSSMPNYIADRWRLKTSNQMVLCILYIVMYMRHTSNFEHALKFATDHIGGALALDLRKVFWDIETGKFSTLKESLDNYLVTWKDYNIEFVEAFHLIESSLYEPSEDRRVTLLEKGLEVMLNGTYEKMLHYAHNLKNPITMLHMLGIVLPVLGLVIFPLLGSFLGGSVKWYHLAFLYNILLPVIVYLFSVSILSKRPTGYGESEITELIPEYKTLEYVNYGGIKVKPVIFGIFIFMILFFVGLLPVMLHIVNPEQDIELGIFGKFLDYKEGNGPYGNGALMFSFFIPLAFALGIGSYFRFRTKKLMKLREATKKLEKEFSGALFQFGNRVGDGIPAELAFGEVAKTMKGTPTGEFFNRVNINISKLGMSMKEAIFNKRVGAILLYPSSLIESSMKVLLQAARKGPLVVSKSLISISNYVDRINNVNERLKDLLADDISSMKSQISFLAPIIAGIVVGLATMIVNIIGSLSEQFTKIPETELSQGVDITALFGDGGLFAIQDVIPSYYFQIVVGVYIVQVVILLSILLNGVEFGVDKLNERNLIGKNLYRSTILYVIVAFVVTLIFNILVRGILAGISTI